MFPSPPSITFETLIPGVINPSFVSKVLAPFAGPTNSKLLLNTALRGKGYGLSGTTFGQAFLVQ